MDTDTGKPPVKPGQGARLALLATACIILWPGMLMAAGQETWFPTAVGTRWVYEATFLLSGAPEQNARWRIIDNIVATTETPEGFVIVRKQDVASGPKGPVNFEADAPVLLIHAGCIYPLFYSQDGSVHGWDARLQELTPEIRRELQGGKLFPIACFPLTVGKGWGAAGPKKSRYSSVVVGVGLDGFKGGGLKLGVPLSPWSRSAYRIRVAFPLQDTWFRPGVGITDERNLTSFPNGEEFTETLVTFRPGNISPRNSQ